MLSMPAIADDNQSEISVWESLLRDRYFNDQPIQEGETIIDLEVPLRAEDSGIVPVSIHAQIPQTEDLYIEKLYVFVDKNPVPLAGLFHLTPEMGRADLAMRLRINEYTYVRAVAQLSNGELHMDTGYTRASGGCTEPPPFLELKQARERIGQMRFRTLGDTSDDARLAHFTVHHPNITGLQLDQRTRAYIPPEFVKTVVLKYNGVEILRAETDISISEDPSFRFFFKPQHGGTLTAYMKDSKGREFTHEFEVTGANDP
jgi:sulfur-oxidizing protein SoxY